MGVGPFSSESTTRVDTRNTAYSTGFSEVSGPATSLNLDLGGKIRVGKGGTLQPLIQLTDQGALNAAVQVSKQAQESVAAFGGKLEGLLTKAIEAVTASSSRAAQAVQAQGSEAIEAVSSANRTETENLGLAAIKWGALVAGGFLLVRALGAMK